MAKMARPVTRATARTSASKKQDDGKKGDSIIFNGQEM
jgi:hypothetical protein